MYKHYIQIDQIQREIEAEVALNEKSAKEYEPATELYSGGWFDGLIGDKSRYPELEIYWSGYSQRNREYWCKKKGITLSNDY